VNPWIFKFSNERLLKVKLSCFLNHPVKDDGDPLPWDALSGENDGETKEDPGDHTYPFWRGGAATFTGRGRHFTLLSLF